MQQKGRGTADRAAVPLNERIDTKEEEGGLGALRSRVRTKTPSDSPLVKACVRVFGCS